MLDENQTESYESGNIWRRANIVDLRVTYAVTGQLKVKMFYDLSHLVLSCITTVSNGEVNKRGWNTTLIFCPAYRYPGSRNQGEVKLEISGLVRVIVKSAAK